MTDQRTGRAILTTKAKDPSTGEPMNKSISGEVTGPGSDVEFPFWFRGTGGIRMLNRADWGIEFEPEPLPTRDWAVIANEAWAFVLHPDGVWRGSQAGKEYAEDDIQNRMLTQGYIVVFEGIDGTVD